LGNGLQEIRKADRGVRKFRGKLATDAKTLAAFEVDDDLDRLADNIGGYAYLKTAEDTADSTYQRMMGVSATSPPRRRSGELHSPRS